MKTGIFVVECLLKTKINDERAKSSPNAGFWSVFYSHLKENSFVMETKFHWMNSESAAISCQHSDYIKHICKHTYSYCCEIIARRSQKGYYKQFQTCIKRSISKSKRQTIRVKLVSYTWNAHSNTQKQTHSQTNKHTKTRTHVQLYSAEKNYFKILKVV